MGIFNYLSHDIMLPFLNFSYHSIFPNYGLAIILLTLMIKILFFPLTQKQFQSMKATQKIQPEMKALQEQYKDQPEVLQKEMLRLWRENNANPLGGCLPLLIQLPIFFAIYHTITSDAFKALLVQPGINPGLLPFWITNLGAPDPWFILPIVIAGATWLSQKMMPVSDPNQAMIFMFMPIMMGAISIKMPAGVLLYWATQQIISNLQQYWMLRQPPKSTDDAITVTVKTRKSE